MTLEKLNIDGPYIIHLDKINDERGYFARFFCQDELFKKGIDFSLKQINTTFTKSKGTIRGFHFQYPPKAEDKIIRCFKGSIFDFFSSVFCFKNQTNLCAATALNKP